MKEYNLNDIRPGQHAAIRALKSTGPMRRRLLDIGLIENTEVVCLGKSPGGDPSAYLIRGAVIAIRSEDCANILIDRMTQPEDLYCHEHPHRSKRTRGAKSYRMEQTPRVVALAGNPNVGKSTVFNGLTGMKQHTGNWPGKTVANARGYCESAAYSYEMVDIPGTYSLMANSVEEEIARNFICFGGPDAVIVVCDATCLERNLNLVLQTMEISSRVIVCVNMMDEAKRKGIRIDMAELSRCLGVPVVGTAAKQKKSLKSLMDTLDQVIDGRLECHPYRVKYPESVEKAIAMLQPVLERLLPPMAGAAQEPELGQEPLPEYTRQPELGTEPESARQNALGPLPESIRQSVLHEKYEKYLDSRWLALKLLDQDASLVHEIIEVIGEDIFKNDTFMETLTQAQAVARGARPGCGCTAQGCGAQEREAEECAVTACEAQAAKACAARECAAQAECPGCICAQEAANSEYMKDVIVSALVNTAEDICRDVVTYSRPDYRQSDLRLDRILTSKRTGYPIMVVLLAFVFWLTIVGANYPSQLLADGLFWIQDRITGFFMYIHAPEWLHGVLVLGVYRVVAWVVSVMLPPMAIFFPLFTLLEDAGYLPRVAYNLDRVFKRCHACGKQALTMCMGFGCNAAGVVGCRIIDSPRERLLAILTNNFVPCNGRFPTLIAILTMFFVGTAGGLWSSVGSAVLLTVVIVAGVLLTFVATRILSRTLLKGEASSFTLELPPYRRPQAGKVIVRSIFDRTLFVLGRAVVVAAPAGVLLWIMANVTIGNVSLLNHCAAFLDPFARLMGLDGVLFMAFILGFPANEIVIPIAIMAYMAQGSLLELNNLDAMKALFAANGWTWITAVSTMIFSLMHWPCSTTLLTIKKETGSWKWTALAAAIPTVAGIVLCMMFTAIARLFM